MLHHFTEMGSHAALASLARAIEELVHEQKGKIIQQQREADFERRAEGGKGYTCPKNSGVNEKRGNHNLPQ